MIENYEISIPKMSVFDKGSIDYGQKKEIFLRS
jgi:hypothetical protein